MPEAVSPTGPERKNRLNVRNILPTLVLGSVALGGTGAIVGHEVWPTHPNGLTVEIMTDGSREHFQINNTLKRRDEPGLDGLGSDTDQLLEGTLDCSYVNQERTVANIGKAVQLTLKIAGASQAETQLFQSAVLDTACGPDGIPKARGGWDIARAYVTSGMSDGVYLG